MSFDGKELRAEGVVILGASCAPKRGSIPRPATILRSPGLRGDCPTGSASIANEKRRRESLRLLNPGEQFRCNAASASAPPTTALRHGPKGAGSSPKPKSR